MFTNVPRGIGREGQGPAASANRQELARGALGLQVIRSRRPWPSSFEIDYDDVTADVGVGAVSVVDGHGADLV